MPVEMVVTFVLAVTTVGIVGTLLSRTRAAQAPTGATNVHSQPHAFVCQVARQARSGIAIPDSGAPLAAFVLQNVLNGALTATRTHSEVAQLARETTPGTQVPEVAARALSWLGRRVGPVERLTLTRTAGGGDRPRDEASRQVLADLFTTDGSPRQPRHIMNVAGDSDLRRTAKLLEDRIEAEARPIGLWDDRPIGLVVFKVAGVATVALFLANMVTLFGMRPLRIWLMVAVGALVGAFVMRERKPLALVAFNDSVTRATQSAVLDLQRVHRRTRDGGEAPLTDFDRAAFKDDISLLYAAVPNMADPMWRAAGEHINGAPGGDPQLREELRIAGWDSAQWPLVDWVYFVTSRMRKAQEMDSD